MRIRIDIMYEGAGFCGWQIQPNLSSVQGELTAAALRLFGQEINLVGSGRTDAGVHALAQVAHFDLGKDFDLKKIAPGLNFYLPQGIRVINAALVSDNFNARFDAKSKTYFYLMYDATVDNPLLNKRAHRVDGLDFCAMEKAAACFVGSYDFSPFMSSGSEIKNTVRTITDSLFCKISFLGSSAFSNAKIEGATAKTEESFAAITPTEPREIRVQNCLNPIFPMQNDIYMYRVSANGFLYNMVRKIVGFLLAIGEGKRSIDDIPRILAHGGAVKEIAPACGLYLGEVEY